MSRMMVFRVDAALATRIRERAARDDVPVSDFMRRAVEQALDAAEEPTPFEAARHLLGKFGSGRSDLSTDHSRILKAKLRAKHDR
jgi:hypothetical protein